MNGDHEGPGGSVLTRLANNETVRRTVRTFLQAFLGILVPGLLGWLHDLTTWAQGEGSTPFPDGRGLAYVGVAAIGAACIAVVTALWNGTENATGVGVLRDVPARRRRPDTGAVDTRTIAIVALVLAVLVILVLLL